MKRPALFLDRDGVININHGYVYKIEDFDFIEGIFDLVKAANDSGYLIIIVTNQAGIGRGYYSEDDFHTLMEWVKNKFTEHGAKIDGVYFSPYHPIHGIGDYKKESNCRKPEPGMLLQAASDFDIDLPGSLLIGDNHSDIKAGLNAGLKTNILFSRTQDSHISNIKYLRHDTKNASDGDM